MQKGEAGRGSHIGVPVFGGSGGAAGAPPDAPVRGALGGEAAGRGAFAAVAVWP